MKREVLSEKLFVLGIDGLDPRLTNKYIAEGIMPNTKKLIEAGACREDLVMLGGHPTITPPMWTTMATGAYAVTHGITCYSRCGKDIDRLAYNIDSRYCKAEQLWNVTAEAGKKTLVWHWPGSSWPPSSDNPNLSVVDGLTPASVAILSAADNESMLVAGEEVKEIAVVPRAAADSNIPCVIEKLESKEQSSLNGVSGSADVQSNLLLYPEDGEHALSDTPFDVILSPVKEPSGWQFEIPADAKETTFVFCNSLVHRPTLILKNEEGIYDSVAVYRNKKTADPIIVMKKNEFCRYIDDVFSQKGELVKGVRFLRIIDMEEDGSKLKLWRSIAMDMSNDDVWSPKSLKEDVFKNVGPAVPMSIVGGGDRKLIEDCMIPCWTEVGNWYADSINFLIENRGYEVVFSHFHNVDIEGHMIIKFLKDHGHNKMSEDEYEEIWRKVYIQTDNYIGKYLHLLEKDWSIFLVSDHAQVASEYEPLMMGDATGVNVRFMEELGLHALKKDENGKDLYQTDWTKTYAVAQRANQIYLNIKGRNDHTMPDGTVIEGLIDPKDQYEWEEEIITRLYSYKHPKSGKRVIALALRNKDAVLLGQGGPEAGDIIYWNAEGYNYDHGDSLSTTLGHRGTSVSPIFAAAGKGIKQNFKTDRIIRQVDLIPTMAMLGGFRMPKQCEGAPIYQIFEEEF